MKTIAIFFWTEEGEGNRIELTQKSCILLDACARLSKKSRNDILREVYALCGSVPTERDLREYLTASCKKEN